MICLSDFVWRHSWKVGTLFPNNSEFNVCLSVCYFAYFLTKIRQRYISWSGWDIFLEFFEDIPETLVHWFQIILNFLFVCQSVSWHTTLLKSHKYRYLQFWMRYLSQISWRHSQDFETPFPNNSDFYYLSVC